MNYEQAIQAANEGHRVRRESWPKNKSITGKEGRIFEGKGDKAFSAGNGDGSANDWELSTVEEKEVEPDGADSAKLIKAKEAEAAKVKEAETAKAVKAKLAEAKLAEAEKASTAETIKTGSAEAKTTEGKSADSVAASVAASNTK